MSGSVPPWTALSNEDEIASKVGSRPSVFLSASVPYLRPDFPDEVRATAAAENQRFFDTRNEPLIQAAIAAFAREIVASDLRVVFGAHPAISPMLLTALRDANRGEVLTFQSALFVGKFPASTLELVSTARGKLFVTDEQAATNLPPGASQKYSEWLARGASLTFMRRCMARVPGLCAAVFVGGMEGTIEEAEIVRRVVPALANRCYAYAASGGAARELLNRTQQNFHGGLAKSDLEDDLSPSLAMRKIFRDLPLAAST